MAPHAELTIHAELDAQHDAMLQALAALHRAVGAGDLEGTKARLASFWETTVAHFAHEEALMEENAYPERNPHRTAHHLFLEDLRELLRAAEAEGLTEKVATWALHRVPEWVAFHLETNDEPLARYLARKTAARIVAGARGEPPPDKPSRRDA